MTPVRRQLQQGAPTEIFRGSAYHGRNPFALDVPVQQVRRRREVAQRERTGVPQSRIVREQLERAMTEAERPFMALAGAAEGPRDLSERKTEPLLTCESVLAEAAFHLRDTALVLRMVREGLVAVALDSRDHWTDLEALAERYADRRPDLADLCLIRLSELHPDHPVVTVDRADFTVYRRNKRETIPTVFPPEG